MYVRVLIYVQRVVSQFRPDVFILNSPMDIKVRRGTESSSAKRSQTDRTTPDQDRAKESSENLIQGQKENKEIDLAGWLDSPIATDCFDFCGIIYDGQKSMHSVLIYALLWIRRYVRTYVRSLCVQMVFNLRFELLER